MRSAPASFARKTRRKKIPPVLQANRRLAFCGGKKESLKDFMVHRDTHSFHYELRKRAECTRRQEKNDQ